MLRFVILATILCIANGRTVHRRSAGQPLDPKGLTGKEELEMSDLRKAALKSMRDSAIFKEIVNPNMMKDIYLVKVIRANSDISLAAEDMLRSALAFRKEQGLDGTKPDVSIGIKKFEASAAEVDVEGRPIMYLQVGKWGMTDAIAAKEIEVYERTFYQLFDDVMNKAIQAFESGKKNAQNIILLNYDGWTSAQGGSPECAAVVGRLAVNYAKTWPGFAHKIILLNTADDFKLFLDLVKPFLSIDIQQRLEVYGRTASEWCPLIKPLMNPTQLAKYCLKV